MYVLFYSSVRTFSFERRTCWWLWGTPVSDVIFTINRTFSFRACYTSENGECTKLRFSIDWPWYLSTSRQSRQLIVGFVFFVQFLTFTATNRTNFLSCTFHVHSEEATTSYEALLSDHSKPVQKQKHNFSLDGFHSVRQMALRSSGRWGFWAWRCVVATGC